ncbi:MAG: hypothetical protein CL674_11820 [Bdellovibrionaceae bacterium]|nr:hypothetical protein [Pseudobdellovibrionaceae bacterium]
MLYVSFVQQNLSYLDILNNEWKSRRQMNPAYSLRAFAKDLGVAASGLSSILNGKQGISEKMARKISSGLGLNAKEEEVFVSLVNAKFHRSEKKKLEAQKKIGERQRQAASFTSLSEDSFRLIADWYHFAILNVMTLDAFDGTKEFISEELGLDRGIITEGIERLLRVGLVNEEFGKFSLKERKNITTTHDVASNALRNSHLQRMKLAANSLQKDPIDERDITFISMGIDKKKLPQAKEMITKFRRELAEFLESGEKNAVYNLNVQLIPLSRRNDNE